MEGVAATAIWTARIRAAETLRPDRLFQDPLAVEIARGWAAATAGAGDAGTAPRRHPLRDYLTLQVVVRTRYYDEFVRAAVAAGCRQVVLVAAGYDSRAFRLDLSETVTVFELDQARVIADKESAIRRLGLRATAIRRPVPVDLRGDDWAAALDDAGHDPNAPTAWLLEGLLVYLDPDAADRLLTGVTRASASGSWLACEHSAAEHDPGNRGADDRDRSGVEASRFWMGGLGEPVDEWLADRGWRCRRTCVAAVAKGCGRDVPVGIRAMAAGRGFVTAQRQP